MQIFLKFQKSLYKKKWFSINFIYLKSATNNNQSYW